MKLVSAREVCSSPRLNYTSADIPLGKTGLHRLAEGLRPLENERLVHQIVCPLANVPLLSPPPTGTDVKEAQVICVSTGTKCINGEYMSDRGLALNDCHAEIIARRSLIRYLYSQLEFFLRSVDSRPASSY